MKFKAGLSADSSHNLDKITQRVKNDRVLSRPGAMLYWQLLDIIYSPKEQVLLKGDRRSKFDHDSYYELPIMKSRGSLDDFL